MIVVLVVAGWLAAGAALALLVCGGIRIADERAGLIPARLDPRAGQYVDQARERVSSAAPGVFTALLLALVLISVGFVQQTFGGA